MKIRIATFALLTLTACASYPPPEASGLIAVRPYPGAGDVCQVIGENDLSRPYLDDSAILIGCPFSESGAIADRAAAGATVVDLIGDWVLLSQPL